MIYKMRNHIQHYHWGTIDFIANLTGFDNKKAEPCAELWMGAHPKCSSEIKVGDKWISLYEQVKENEDILTRQQKDRFGGFPYLFKILSIDSPLSIQVHPTIEQAQSGYLKENRAGIPLDGTNRNYKDKNHKPEIICAISDFWALKGFLPSKKIIRNFNFASEPFLRDLTEKLTHEAPLESFFLWLMNLSREERETLLEQFYAHAPDCVETTWVKELNRHYPGDVSVLAPLYLNLVHLAPGEALFQEAGELHAYLKGNGVELMANSDNVLRGGLTSKHMDLEELKNVVEFKASNVRLVESSDGYFSSPVADFQLAHIKAESHILIDFTRTPVILLNRGDSIILESHERKVVLGRGETLLITASDYSLSLRGPSIDCYAALPGQQS